MASTLGKTFEADPTSAHPGVPPLVAGDRLTADEFLQRWNHAPGIKFAELLGGEVFMPSPLSISHGDLDPLIAGWLIQYVAATPGPRVGSQITTRMLQAVPQPDIHLRLLPEYSGSSKPGKDDYLEGPPELLIEISGSSVARNLGLKLNLYQDAGVQEYLVVLFREKEIRWHRLIDNQFQVLAPGSDGIWRSQVFPGLWLNGQALLDGALQDLLATVHQGIASPEHQAFVAELARRKTAIS